jgi:hypothetical protein
LTIAFLLVITSTLPLPPCIARVMHFSHLKHDSVSLRVEVHGCDEAFANMLRRALTDVPVPATTRVTVRRNTSAFPNEVLAHRIGMLPLKSLFAAHRHATLKEKGPKVVRGSDVRAEDVEVASPEALVVCLAEGEELDMDLHVELGTGKDHARHSASVAARCVRRHEGMQRARKGGGEGGEEEERREVPLHERLPVECFCPSTGWGTRRCKECAGEKRREEERNAPVVFVMELETTGALLPLELLRRGMEIAEAQAANVAKRVAGGGEGTQGGYGAAPRLPPAPSVAWSCPPPDACRGSSRFFFEGGGGERSEKGEAS